MYIRIWFYAVVKRYETFASVSMITCLKSGRLFIVIVADDINTNMIVNSESALVMQFSIDILCILNIRHYKLRIFSNVPD